MRCWMEVELKYFEEVLVGRSQVDGDLWGHDAMCRGMPGAKSSTAFNAVLDLAPGIAC